MIFHQACYDVREGSVFWARMGLHEEISEEMEKVPEWLSTHPSHKKRVEYIDFLLPQVSIFQHFFSTCTDMEVSVLPL